MQTRNPEDLSSRLLTAFFRFQHTPWHLVPAPGLSRAETGVLIAIEHSAWEGQRLRVSDISKRMRVSSPTITQHINNLEAQGFVQRTQSQKDKRAVNLSLTDKGTEALRRQREMMENNTRELVDLLGEQNASALVDLLTRTSEFFIEKQKGYGGEK